MNTALLEPGFTRTGCGRIRYIFGDFSQGLAHIVLDDYSLLHLHGTPGLETVEKAFGSLEAAPGSRVRYTANALGVLLDLAAG